MARCYEAGLDRGSKQQAPSHGHLDMARAHTSMWRRHTDAPDAWSAGWCTLLGSKDLDQRHVDGHLVKKGTLHGRRQLVRGTLQQLGE